MFAASTHVNAMHAQWYGWHFPEMGKIITDNIQYAKVVRKMGMLTNNTTLNAIDIHSSRARAGVRSNAAGADLSDILEEEAEKEAKAAAEVSMGSDIAEEDIENIKQLCDQVISIAEYRTALYEYLKNRMNAIGKP